MSRAVRVTGHRLIRASLQRVWTLLSRPEIHARYAALWMAVDVLERSPGSSVVELRGFFGGLPITSVQRFTYRPPWRVEFRQVRGELRGLHGAYVLKDADGETDLSCEIVADAGIQLFSEAAVHQVLAGHIDGTLARLKAASERDLVRVVRRRPTAAAAADDEAVDADAEDPAAAPTEVLMPADSAAAGPAAVRGEEAGDDDTPADQAAEEAGEDDEPAPWVPGAVPGTPAATRAPAPERRHGRRRRRRRRGHGRPQRLGGTPDPSAPAGSGPTPGR